MQRMYRRPRGWSGPWSAEENGVAGRGRATRPKLWCSSSVLPGRKFQSHPGVPPGRLIETRCTLGRNCNAPLLGSIVLGTIFPFCSGLGVF